MAEHPSFTTANPIILLLDVSRAANSAQACHMAEEFAGNLSPQSNPIRIDIVAGDVLLTRSVLVKIKQILSKVSASIGIVYGAVPQTQQAALDEGFFAKEKLTDTTYPLRQPLPLSEKSKFASVPKAQLEIEPTSNEVVAPELVVPESNTDEEKVASEETFNQEIILEEVSLPLETERVEAQGNMFQLQIQELGIEHTFSTSESAGETLYLRQTLRSGQTIRYSGHIVIIGDVHAGGEIVAGGDIVVWGELKGIAHAGSFGDYRAQIRAMKIEALQLRIADYIARRPDRIYYHKDDSSQAFNPELAKVADGEIKIFKTILPHTRR